MPSSENFKVRHLVLPASDGLSGGLSHCQEVMQPDEWVHDRDCSKCRSSVLAIANLRGVDCLQLTSHRRAVYFLLTVKHLKKPSLIQQIRCPHQDYAAGYRCNKHSHIQREEQAGGADEMRTNQSS